MKHGWNSLDRYLSIHDTILRQYHRFMVNPKFYTVEEITPQFIMMICERIMLRTKRDTVVGVDIRKEVEVDGQPPSRQRARTFHYSFSAYMPSGNPLIRSCGPHKSVNPDESPDHHNFHHRHDFTTGKEKITKVANDDWPHVNEFLDEVRERF